MACTLLYDIVVASRQRLQSILETEDGVIYPPHSIFNRSYDVIVPLPSSGGPGASESNKTAALAVASAFSPIPGDDGGPTLEEMVLRVQPMRVKSTKTDRHLRKHRDAPRRLHFSNMLVNESLIEQIKGTKILLWDDVCTWGNTSEAARNLLLMAGASRVDVITAFSNGPITRAHTYSVSHNDESDTPADNDRRVTPTVSGKVGDHPDPDSYKQHASVLVSKELIEWDPDSENGSLRD